MARKQKELPGVEQEKNPAVEDAADGYVSLRDKWQTLGTKLTAAKTELLQAMHNAGLASYRYDDYVITLEAKEKITVKKASDPDEEEDDD